MPSLSHMIRFAATQPPARARMVVHELVAKAGESAESDAALDAFHRDMQPLCDAIVSALQDDDRAALEGLRALLPNLMREINEEPLLADLLIKEMGIAMLEGMKQ